MNKTRIASRVAMLVATIIWGYSFILVKDNVDIFEPMLLLALRFTIAPSLLAIVFAGRFVKLNRGYLIYGMLMGTALFSAYALQTYGITDTATTPGKNAFLTAVYCVIVPFLVWITDKKRPDIFNIISAFLCIAGIALVSLKGSITSIAPGDLLSLGGGVMFAVHMIVVAKASHNRDPIILTIIQFATAAVLSWIFSLSTETMPKTIGLSNLLAVLFLAVFATAIGLLLQTVGQKFSPPSEASIILSLESVFGVVFSVIYGMENVTPKLMCGFALIFISVIISETKLSFLRFGKANIVSQKQ